MGALYDIDVSRSILYMEYRGPSDPREAFDLTDRMLADTRVGPGLRLISDHSGETSASRLVEVQPLMARFVAVLRRLQSSRLAVVATKPVVVGLMNQIAAYATLEGIEIRVFEDRKDAEAWLDDGDRAGSASAMEADPTRSIGP